MVILRVDLIFDYCALALILLACIGIYVLLVSRILPRRLLSPQRVGILCDRGVKKCVFPEGRSVTYEPKLSVRKYVSQYVLFSHDGGKYIKCKIHEKVKSLVYELVIYDRKDEVINTLEITEKMDMSGYTANVMLPPETSYVHLEVRQVNGFLLKENTGETYIGKNAVLFCFYVFILTLFIGLFANYVIISICDVFLGYFVWVPSVDFWPPLLVILAASVLVSIIALLFNISIPCKMVWNKKRKAEKN